MPFGYLITTGLMAWLTFFAALAPPPKRASPSRLRHWFGFMVNELPALGLAWLLASTLLAWSEGDLGSPVGLAGLAMAVAAAIGPVLRAASTPRSPSAAATPRDPRFHPGFEAADTSVTAAAYYGYYHGDAPRRRRRRRRICGRTRRRSSSPTATAMLMPVADAPWLVAGFRAVSTRPVVYANYQGGRHTFALHRSVRFTHVVAGIEAFAGGRGRREPAPGRLPDRGDRARAMAPKCRRGARRSDRFRAARRA